jgi:hypothetical protein
MLVRLIDRLTDDEVEALMAALPALQHLAALDSEDREGPKTLTGWSLDTVTVNSDERMVSRLRLSGARRAVAELDKPWAEGVRTRIRPGLFDHITTNR